MQQRTIRRSTVLATVVAAAALMASACVGGGVPGAHLHSHSGFYQKKITLNGCTVYVGHSSQYAETSISGSCPNGTAALTMDFSVLDHDGKRRWTQCSTFSGQSGWGFADTVNNGKVANCWYPHSNAQFLYTTHYVLKPGNLKFYYLV